MKTLTIYKQVPTAQRLQHLNLGWREGASERGDSVDGYSLMFRTLFTFERHDRTDYIEFERPKIRPACIYRPLGCYKELPLQRAVAFEEPGDNAALDHSLRRIESHAPLYKIATVGDIEAYDKFRKAHPLRIYHNLDPAKFEQYLEMLQEMFYDSWFGLRIAHEEQGAAKPNLVLDTVDFWWDTKNDVLLTFDKQFVSNVHHMIRASLNRLNTP